jgi:hypothetical protein
MHLICSWTASRMKERTIRSNLVEEGQSYLKKVLEIEECVEPFNRDSAAREQVVNDLDHFG